MCAKVFPAVPTQSAPFEKTARITDPFSSYCCATCTCTAVFDVYTVLLFFCTAAVVVVVVVVIVCCCNHIMRVMRK